VVNYVLKKPSADDRTAIDKASEQSLKATDLLMQGAMDKALAAIHAQPQRPKPPRPAPAGPATSDSGETP
jgi:PTH1 family peptidyl-tRNA hydrolase